MSPMLTGTGFAPVAALQIWTETGMISGVGGALVISTR